MDRSKYLEYIENPDLLKALRHIGCEEKTYEEALGWFRERGLISIVYPSLGDKIGYDTYSVRGYLYEVDIVTDKFDGVYISYNWMDKFVNSYKTDIGLDDKDSLHPKEGTYRQAIDGAVKLALYIYHIHQVRGECDKIKKIEPREFPEFGYIKYNDAENKFMMFISTNKPDTYSGKLKYNLWKKDVYGKEGTVIEVAWDGKEFLVDECYQDYRLVGKKFYPTDPGMFIYQLYSRRVITDKESEKLFKDEQASRKIIFGD